MQRNWDALPPAVRRWAPPLLLALLFGALTFVAAINHDESQYVGATWLIGSGLPYRDFAYLQTPLQPLLYWPMSALTDSYLLLASRLANAVLAAAGVWFVWAALRASGVGRKAALASCVLLASCAPLLFAATVARNDVLPFCLFAGALWQVVETPSRRRAFLIGLLMGAATAAKISYAIPAATILLLGLFGPKVVRERIPAIPYVAGTLPAALLVIGLAATAPDAFLFEVVRYAVDAPRQWYQLTAKGERLTAVVRLSDFIRFGINGPAIAALLCLALSAWTLNFRAYFAGPRRSIVASLLVASLVSAIMPSPMQKQYWLPALPPLFLCLGIAIERGLNWRRPAWAVLLASAIAGWVPTAKDAVAAVTSGNLPPLAVAEDSSAIDQLLDQRQVDGPIVTLRPDLFSQTDERLDPRFAAGPFLFRSTGLVSPSQARRWQVLDGDDQSLLVANPPAAFVFADQEILKSGDDLLSAKLMTMARSAGFGPVARRGRLTLWLPLKYSPTH